MVQRINKEIKAELALTAGDSDVWGWVNGWLFAIAETLFVNGMDVPSEWEFRPSPMMSVGDDLTDDGYEHNMIQVMIDSHLVTEDDLQHAGNVLVRYAAWCKIDGRDY